VNVQAPVINPNTTAFIESVMKPLALRLQNGESREQIGVELLEAIYPWVLSQIRGSTYRLPTGADESEIASRMLEVAYRRALTFDPSCPQSWPTGLKQGLRGAWLEAYRAVDFLNRKHRYLHNLYRHAVADAESDGRTLTWDEKRAIATQLVPQSSRTDWVDILLHHTPPPPARIEALDWDTLRAQLHSSDEDPATECVDKIINEKISAWLETLPAHLSSAIEKAIERKRPVPPRVRVEIANHLESLREVDHDLWTRAAAMASL